MGVSGGSWMVVQKGCISPQEEASVSLWLRKGWKVPRNCQEGVAASVVGVQCIWRRPRTHTTCFCVPAAWVRGWGPEEADANISFWGGHCGQGPVPEPCPLSLSPASWLRWKGWCQTRRLCAGPLMVRQVLSEQVLLAAGASC